MLALPTTPTRLDPENRHASMPACSSLRVGQATSRGSGRGASDSLVALHALLGHALELDAGDRAAWLATLHEEQPEHARELEALLAGEPELDAQRFLMDGVWDGRESLGPGAHGEPTLAGRRMGAYTLEHPLGRGGMGSVWLARRSDGRYEGAAAVKFLNLALLDPVGSERFRREGTTLARLSHPNIARLLDAGVTEEGQPFLVLEHVEGRRIDAYCDEECLSPGRRISLFLQVLAAVEHAHAKLIVHRDLKPSNILVTADGTVKLLDFGIAKLLGAGTASEELTELTELTDVGGLALTPEYAAPEQVTSGPITRATDVYALGVLLYRLLAGCHPTAEGCRTTREHLRRVLDAEPLPLSAAITGSGALTGDALERLAAARATAAGELRRLYRRGLDNVVAKALRKRPEERYETVAAFADDLRRFLANEPVRARPDAVSYRARSFVRRHRAAIMTRGLVALSLATAATVTAVQTVEARRQRQRVARLEQQAAQSAALLEALLQNGGRTERRHPGNWVSSTVTGTAGGACSTP